MLSICVLGRYRITCDSAPVVFPTRSADAVLAYLALARGARVDRDELARTLWPDKDREAARTNLRTTLYRVRATLPDIEPILSDRRTLALNLSAASTDLDHADELHRAFEMAPGEAGGIPAGLQEWCLRRQDALVDWDHEWVEPERRRFGVLANELGCELAKAMEDFGDGPAALQIWKEILDRVPQHMEALQHAIRLESEIRGTESALAFAQHATRPFERGRQVQMTESLKRQLTNLRAGAKEALAEPTHIRKRSELLLLAKMFESNLAGNQSEALAFLAKTAENPRNHGHPRALLGLLVMALERSSGTSPDRLAIATRVANLASHCSRFDIGHKWTQFVIDNSSESEIVHSRAMTMKGHLFLEERNYGPAREYLVRAVDCAARYGFDFFRLSAISNLANLECDLMEFDEALLSLQTIFKEATKLPETRCAHAQAAAYFGMSSVFALMQNWPDAILHARACQERADEFPLYGHAVSRSLGLALFCEGRRREGIRELIRGINFTAREGIHRFNQSSLDFAAVALESSGRSEEAECLLDANSEQRFSIRNFHSPAESNLLVRTANLDPARRSAKGNPLRGQLPATLSAWACEELERTMATVG
jgi:DNA-binding SARP family transcriptional activator